LKKERTVSQLACTEHSQVSQYACALIIIATFTFIFPYIISCIHLKNVSASA